MELWALKMCEMYLRMDSAIGQNRFWNIMICKINENQKNGNQKIKYVITLDSVVNKY